MQFITYADRLGGNLPGLRSLLRNEFEGLFSGVHILPFFDPIDGADAGFDPVDHTRVDARIGDWGDIAAIAADHSVMADLIVNHVSADSPQFKDVQRRGTESSCTMIAPVLGSMRCTKTLYDTSISRRACQ